MRSNLLWKILFLALVTLVLACGGGKYSDAVEVSNKFADATEEYIDTMEKANDAPSVVRALNAYAGNIEKIAPKMKKVAEKYPELKDQTSTPPELQKSQERMDAMARKMTGAMMKPMMHMKDPEVRKAQQRLQNAMRLMK